jgi:hypothetical protein
MKESKKYKGGKARALVLTKEQRVEIAIKASKSRCGKLTPRAIYSAEENPLIIGDIRIPCYVLDNGKRVLIQRNMAGALGRSDTGGNRINDLINLKFLVEFVTPELRQTLENPIIFKGINGNKSMGYEATVLIDICDAIITAKENEKIALTPKQKELVVQCEKIIRSVAKVGIIALVDEATGYQEDRERNALAIILEQFISDELRPWLKTFPYEYYKQLFRLKNLEFPSANIPSYFGHITNNIVYKRLAPKILINLKEKTPISKNGHKTARLHQSLTADIGYSKLKEHLASIVTLMKISSDYDGFIEKLDMVHPLFEDA